MIKWNELRNKCKELKLFPEGEYNPTYLPFESCSWFDLLSERGLGKTTALILLAMTANKMFGTIAEYIRLTEEMTKPKALAELMSVIIKFNYIPVITEGRWNSCFYYANQWKYCNRDLDGKITEKDERPFMHVVCITHASRLKSAYNNPTGDIIIVDEFIDNQTPYNDFFFYLCDIASTVFRKRENCKLFLLANTIDIRSPWFSEQGILKDVSGCKLGERKILSPEGTTKIYFEIIANKRRGLKDKINDLYFGFKNPKLNAITGRETWAYSLYPLYERSVYDEENMKWYKYKEETLYTYYMDCEGFMIQCRIVNHELYGFCVLAREWNGPVYDDEIIIVNHTPAKHNEYFLTQIEGIYSIAFKNLFRNRKWYYKNNSSAISVTSFMSKLQ